MQDDGKKIVEDDLIDDDMDFGDFDDDFEDDLDVDLGGDLADGADLSVDDWDGVDDDDLDGGPKSVGDGSSQDSFLKKNFNLIVIAVAVLGGGGFVLTQMGGAPVSAPTPTQIAPSEEIVDLDMGEMPPAPAAMDADADVSGLPLEAADVLVDDISPFPVEVSEDATLTPLPTFDGDQVDLVPLDFLSDETPVDSPVEDLSVATQLPAELPYDLDVPRDVPNDVQDDVFEADLEVIVDNPLVDLVVEPVEDAVDLPVFEEETLVEEASAAVDVVDESAALVDSLRQENQEKDVVIQGANGKIADLESTVGALQAELEAMKVSLDEARGAAAVKAVAAPVASETVDAPVPAKILAAAPAKKPAVNAVPEAAPVADIAWVLRAAQPGKAMIYNPKTQNVLNVENGDVVPGTGSINSISMQDGLWVVEGSKGRITQ
jgi:hypothetical protein